MLGILFSDAINAAIASIVKSLGSDLEDVKRLEVLEVPRLKNPLRLLLDK